MMGNDQFKGLDSTVQKGVFADEININLNDICDNSLSLLAAETECFGGVISIVLQSAWIYAAPDQKWGLVQCTMLLYEVVGLYII